MKTHIWIILFLFFPAEFLSAQNLSVANIFTDNAILQRNKTNKIWGNAHAGEIVKLTFAGKKYQTTAGVDGNWSLTTEVLKSGGPYLMQITSREDTVQLKNILIGDVWICSGQSNMEFSVGNFPWAKDEIATANNQQIHFYTLPNTIDLIPNTEVPKSNWEIATGNDLLSLSATAYFFAKNIQPEIGVPVGLIVTDWSGTAIEPWMSPDALKPFPQFRSELEKLQQFTENKSQVENKFQQYRKDGWDTSYYLKGKGMEEK